MIFDDLYFHCIDMFNHNHYYTRNIFPNLNKEEGIILTAYITRFAECLVYTNHQNDIKQYFCNQFNYELQIKKIDDIDFNYYNKGDKGDIIYYLNDIKRIISVKSAYNDINLISNILNSLYEKHKKQFCQLVILLIHNKAEDFEAELKNNINNKDKLFDIVNNQVYKDYKFKIFFAKEHIPSILKDLTNK